MTATAWAHLSNAAHIDRILTSSKKSPKKWDEAQYAARDEAWAAAWHAVQNPARYVARDAAFNAIKIPARGIAWDAAWDAARGTILALVAWDDCAYILELPEDVLKVLRAVGNEQAILLSTAAHALRETS